MQAERPCPVLPLYRHDDQGQSVGPALRNVDRRRTAKASEVKSWPLTHRALGALTSRLPVTLGYSHGAAARSSCAGSAPSTRSSTEAVEMRKSRGDEANDGDERRSRVLHTIIMNEWAVLKV